MWINMAFSASIFHQDGKQEGLLDILPNISPSNNKRKMERDSRGTQHHNTMGQQCGNMQEIRLLCNWLDTHKKVWLTSPKVQGDWLWMWTHELGVKVLIFVFYLSCYYVLAMSACLLAVGADFGYLGLRCQIRVREQGIKNDGGQNLHSSFLCPAACTSFWSTGLMDCDAGLFYWLRY